MIGILFASCVIATVCLVALIVTVVVVDRQSSVRRTEASEEYLRGRRTPVGASRYED